MDQVPDSDCNGFVKNYGDYFCQFRERCLNIFSDSKSRDGP